MNIRQTLCRLPFAPFLSATSPGQKTAQHNNLCRGKVSGEPAICVERSCGSNKQCFSGEGAVGQVPTLGKYSDSGTKCLPRGRLFFFMTFSRWTSVDPATLEMIGQERHAMVTFAAEAANPEICQVFSGHSHVEFFWFWAALGIHSLGCV